MNKTTYSDKSATTSNLSVGDVVYTATFDNFFNTPFELVRGFGGFVVKKFTIVKVTDNRFFFDVVKFGSTETERVVKWKKDVIGFSGTEPTGTGLQKLEDGYTQFLKSDDHSENFKKYVRSKYEELNLEALKTF